MKKKLLKWKSLNHHVSIAVVGDCTYVLTKVASGKPNRFDLAVCNGNNPPVCMGNELPPSHCKEDRAEGRRRTRGVPPESDTLSCDS